MPISTAEDLRLNVQALKELPPLPENAQLLLDAVIDDDIEIGDLAKLIESSPSISARIVGLARSAFFAQPVPVRSIADAVIRVLGLALVKNLVISIATSAVLDPKRCAGFDAERYWRTALLSAGLSRALAREMLDVDTLNPDTAYLCGLLHNLGVLALTHVAPREMSRVFQQCAEQPEVPIVRIENQVLGTDHCSAGALLAARWHLPEEVGRVMAFYLEPGYRGDAWPLCSVVGFSADWSGRCLSGEEEPPRDLERVDVLGLDEAAVAGAIDKCRPHLGEVDELARLFARAGP